jgi:hypothetical protein
MVHSFKEFLYSILQEKDSDVVCTPVSGFDAGGRNVTALPNSFDFGDILKFGALGAGVGCATGPNSGDFSHIVGWKDWDSVGYIENWRCSSGPADFQYRRELCCLQILG